MVWLWLFLSCNRHYWTPALGEPLSWLARSVPHWHSPSVPWKHHSSFAVLAEVRAAPRSSGIAALFSRANMWIQAPLAEGITNWGMCMYTHRGILLSNKQEWNSIICSKMIGAGGHHVAQNESNTERQKASVIPYIGGTKIYRKKEKQVLKGSLPLFCVPKRGCRLIKAQTEGRLTHRHC